MRCGALFLGTLLVIITPHNDDDLDVITLNGMDCGLEGKPGGSEAQKDLNRHKNRYAIPGDSDIDPEVSLPAMLAPGKDVKRFDQERAARITGFVINVKPGGTESCNCGATDPAERDTHVELCLADGAPESQRVIVEITPRLRMLKKKADIDWTTPALEREIKGKWVEVTGWLLFDTAHINQAENTNPGHKGNWRATCWEIHPVTNIKVLDGAPLEAAGFQPDSLSALHRLHAGHLAQSANGKAAFEKLHKESLAQFHKKELQEAEKESEERQARPSGESGQGAGELKGTGERHPLFPDFGFTPPTEQYDGKLFRLRQDYPDHKPGDGELPEFLKIPFDQNRDGEQNWKKYLLAVRDYCFEGNIDTERVAIDKRTYSTDWNLWDNRKRKWFHAPWQHFGPNGREGIHGLTREATAQPKQLGASQVDPFQTYAVGFYNEFGTQVIAAKRFMLPGRPLRTRLAGPRQGLRTDSCRMM